MLADSAFIVVEGIDGCGKSTQADHIASVLQTHSDQPVLLTREPGGAPGLADGASMIREILLGRSQDDTDPLFDDPLSEALLMATARRDHLRHAITPALNGGTTVVCDRFCDSTTAYQGWGDGVDLDFLVALNRVVTDLRIPDLTLVFDLDPEIALGRAMARSPDRKDRFETRGIGFYQRVRDGFLDCARLDPDRYAVIDADAPVDAVSEQVDHVLRLHGLLPAVKPTTGETGGSR